MPGRWVPCQAPRDGPGRGRQQGDPEGDDREELEGLSSRIPVLQHRHHRFSFSPLVALAWASIWRIRSSSPELNPR